MKNLRIISILVFIAGSSGFCSLVYQVVWDRIVKYNFGGDTISSTIVTGTFLLGLGIGAYLFGAWQRDAFRTYFFVEAAIGLFGMASFYIIAPVSTFLTRFFAFGAQSTESLRVLVIFACIVLLLPPCILIGGTLPLMFRCFIRPLHVSATSIGFIYGINTLGASLGILAVPLFFLNHLSLPSTLFIVGSFNVWLAAFIIITGRKYFEPKRLKSSIEASASSHTEQFLDCSRPSPPSRKTILFVVFLSGFITTSFETSLFRVFSVTNPGSAYNFPLVLFFFLLALSLGSIFFSKDMNGDKIVIFFRVGWLLFLSAAAILVSVVVGGYMRAAGLPISIFSSHSFAAFFSVLFYCVFLIALVPFFSGAIFPLLLRLLSPTEQSLPRATGTLYLLNSLGCFSGAIVGKFWGFAAIGTYAYLSILVLIGAGVGSIIILWCDRKNSQVDSFFKRTRAYFLFGVVSIFVAILPSRLWLSYISRGAGEVNSEMIEGVTGVSEIIWREDYGEVVVNGLTMSHLPHHPRHMKQEVFIASKCQRKSVLILGLGSGGIVHTLANDESVERIYAVDWSFELPRILSQKKAGRMIDHVLLSDKVVVIGADARVAVDLLPKESFDVVFDNLSFPGLVGTSNLNSVSYFRKIRRLLRPNGIFLRATNYFGDNRLAVLSGLRQVFPIVKEHQRGEIVVSSMKSYCIDKEVLLGLLKQRASIINTGSGDDNSLWGWYSKGFHTITSKDLNNREPMRDDLLIYEYFLRPFF